VAHTLAESFALAGVVAGRVLSGDSLTTAMADVRASGPLRSAVQDLAFSALRDYGRASAALAALLKKPPTPSLHGLLLAAVHELAGSPHNPHAVVHQAVEAAARVAPRNPEGAKSLVNGVLRNFLRRQDDLIAVSQSNDEGRYRHPQWWINRVKAAWPDDWLQVLEAANALPPMTLRVNARKTTILEYQALLTEQGIEAVPCGPQALQLQRPLPVDRLPGFRDGWVSVQDWGAQQAAGLLDVQPGMCVLDACAAPGGKTAHILEGVDCRMTAADVDEARLVRVRESLQRLGLTARVVCEDALKPASLAQDGPYDRILADVPCTASGVVRRHPDIKWLRRESDIARFARTQKAMLEALWPLLAPGGKLLYATCSVFPEENTNQVEAFLRTHPDASRLPLSQDPASAADPAWRDGGQLLPNAMHDGFYYALLAKAA
jgi:16S rRNA (cytosine967-C5)-methyltransferase